jgi:hypothetical protein
MTDPIRKIVFDRLPGDRYTLTSSVEVHIYSNGNGGFIATAPELGMWVDGWGQTEDDAVADLWDAILEQRDSLGARPEAEYSEYARVIKRTFEQRFVEGRS